MRDVSLLILLGVMGCASSGTTIERLTTSQTVRVTSTGSLETRIADAIQAQLRK
jgi:hypothetical protein